LSLWPPDNLYLPLARDATTIGDNFTILSINVLIRASGIPLAWRIVLATEKGSCQPLWKQLFESLKAVVPSSLTTIVCASRGLYASWLYDLIVECGWQEMLRINHQGTFRHALDSNWHSLSSLMENPGKSWSGKVTCFKTNPINCTLLARWEPAYKDPWLVLTDLEPEMVDVVWYSLCSGIDCSYRDIKSDGWQWPKNRLIDSQRAEIIWLAMAVATLWTLSVGGNLDTQRNLNEAATTEDASFFFPYGREPRRHLSCFLVGLITIFADLLNGKHVYLSPLLPEPWPNSLPLAIPNTS